jgi:hypothetical protein
MMNRTIERFVILLLVLVVAVSFTPGRSDAKRFKVKGMDFWSTGYYRQNIQIGTNDPDFSTPGVAQQPGVLGPGTPALVNGGLYQLNGNEEGVTQMLGTFYSENQLFVTPNLELRLSLRYEGDFVDNFKNDDGVWDAGSGQAFDKYRKENDLKYDREINEIVRECTVAYFSRYYSIRAGKQQMSWGESDGLRLMDQINGLDTRRDFILRDADEGFLETRMPLWMVKADFTPDFTFGNSLGLSNLDLEVSWIPDVRMQNRAALGAREGGVWSAPLPDVPLPLVQLNAIKDYPSQSIDNGSYGVRLKGMIGRAFFTVNAYYGWSKNSILTDAGYVDPLLGTALGAAAHNLGVIRGPGLGLTPLAPLAGPASNANFQGNVGDAVDMSAVLGLPPTSLYGLTLTLGQKSYRQKVFGFTLAGEPEFTRPFFRAMRQTTLPVFRFEAAYEPDVRFNYGTDDYIARLSSNWLWNTNETTRDIYRYLIGIDYNAHCRFINPVDDVTVSLQFSQSIMDQNEFVDELTAPNAFDPLLATAATIALPGGPRVTNAGFKQRIMMAPYFWFPKQVESYASLSLRSEYMGSNLVPAFLGVGDLTTGSWLYKAKVDYKYQNKWIFGLGYNSFYGDPETSFGLYDKADCLFGSIKYQW